MNTKYVYAIMGLAIASLLIGQSTANGQSAVQDISQTVDSFVQETIQECSIIFDTGDTKSDISAFCEKIMDTIDLECRDNYHYYCFGQAWTNYEKQKHLNPPFCRVVDC